MTQGYSLLLLCKITSLFATVSSSHYICTKCTTLFIFQPMYQDLLMVIVLIINTQAVIHCVLSVNSCKIRECTVFTSQWKSVRLAEGGNKAVKAGALGKRPAQ